MQRKQGWGSKLAARRRSEALCKGNPVSQSKSAPITPISYTSSCMPDPVCAQQLCCLQHRCWKSLGAVTHRNSWHRASSPCMGNRMIQSRLAEVVLVPVLISLQSCFCVALQDVQLSTGEVHDLRTGQGQENLKLRACCPAALLWSAYGGCPGG